MTHLMNIENRKAGAITLELRRVRSGDHPITRKLFELWFDRLSRLGRRLLTPCELRVIDGEDLALEVLSAFFFSLEEGFVDQHGNPIPIHSRLDVWKMLASRLRQRASNVRRDQRTVSRGAGNVRGESAFHSKDDLNRGRGIENVPDHRLDDFEQEIRLMHEELTCAFQPGELRDIAELTLEGNSPAEIAQQLGISPSKVYRKLSLIHSHWASSGSFPE
jgi:DNA-directed RNA polymerase specialized sigma24 family protein